MLELVEQFAALFNGNQTAVGTEQGGCARIAEPYTWRDQIEGHLTGGPPIGVYPMMRGCTPDPTTIVRDADSVSGATMEEWRVRWGCVDFDVMTPTHKSFDYETEGEAHIAAVNLQNVLAAMGIAGWIERTRSHGRHVWVFADGWVSAAAMRRSLLVACGVAGVSSREVNPKSETLGEGQLGNYVRTMYPNGLNEIARSDVAGRITGGRGGILSRRHEEERLTTSSGGVADDGSGRGGARCVGCGLRRVGVCDAATSPTMRSPEAHVALAGAGSGRGGSADDDDSAADGRPSAGEDSGVPCRVAIDADCSPFCLACFVTGALASRVAPAIFAEIASLYVPPEKLVVERLASDAPYEGDLVDRMLPYTLEQFEEDMPDDRSGALQRLAALCARQRRKPFEPAEILELLYAADDRWRKYADRSDRDLRLVEIVERAYA